MSTNIPLGSHFEDGVRSGPIYSGNLPTGFVADINGVITSSDFSTYGPGVLLSPQNTYNIVPSPANTAGGFTVLTNVVATTADGAVPAATQLTLLGDNAVTYLTTGANGLPLLQLDWPRVISVTIAGAAVAADADVTIIGFDYYGFPMQQTYTVNAEGTYPTETNAGGGGDGELSLPAKAFYQVTKAYINFGLPAGCTISLGASEIFGLPYLVNGIGSITSVAWGAQDGGAGSPIIPTTQFVVSGVTGFITTKGAFVPGDKTLPTAFTGDVRGLYSPSSVQQAQIIDGVAVDYKRLIFTAYVQGMDTRIDQVASQQQQYTQQTGNPPQGIPVIPLVPADAYGLPQFYTGVPS